MFTINSVFAKISPILHDYFKTNKDKAIHLIAIVHEYNQLYREFGSDWKKPLYSLLEYALTEHRKNPNLDRDRLCIIPFIAGTFSQSASQDAFISSGYNMQLFSLPPFEREIVKQLIEIRFGNQSGILLSNEEMKKFWYEISIVPRILIHVAFPYMKKKLDQKEIQTEEDITDDCILEMRKEIYKNHRFLGPTIMQHETQVTDIILSGLDMRKLKIGDWLDQAILFGTIYREYRGKCTCILSIFSYY